ncbi:MAG: pyridoxal phosphate-dependent aminotransferase family protein [Sediminibacterium sp.]
MYQDDFLQRKLQERTANHALRVLRLPEGKTDFCSNDYLGIVKNSKLRTPDSGLPTGSTGSRLLAGNYLLIEMVEKEIAAFHGSDAALIFNSGYDANAGLLSCVPQKGDTVIYDYLCHASIRDGIRLSFAQAFSFAHNDLADLEKKIQHATGTVFIVTESVFSMDGDLCPLADMVVLSKKYQAHLIIDEAHATGVIGEKGEGLVKQLGLQEEVFARVHTFGKACGCHGAGILGSVQLRNYLINFARSFIYSTALPAHAMAMVQASYALFPLMNEERKQLYALIKQFQQAPLIYEKLFSSTPIQAVIIPGNEAVKRMAQHLQEQALDVRPILYPTVPKDKERLRIVLHSFNTKEELSQLLVCLAG